MAAIEDLVMHESRRITGDWTVLPSSLSLPDMGYLVVNSFLLKSSEPMLVDTGLAAVGDAYLEALWREIDPADLRWIWLSHIDADHVGNLRRVLERAPQAEVITNFLGMGKMTLAGMDVSRVRLLDDQAPFSAGDRCLEPVRPPYYDAPETVGFFDREEGVFFAADSFGALLPKPAAETGEIGDETLRKGMVAWSSIDAPWLASVDRVVFAKTLDAFEHAEPRFLLSAHLPLARNGIERLTAILRDTWCSESGNGMDMLAAEQTAPAFG